MTESIYEQLFIIRSLIADFKRQRSEINQFGGRECLGNRSCRQLGCRCTQEISLRGVYKVDGKKCWWRLLER